MIKLIVTDSAGSRLPSTKLYGDLLVNPAATASVIINASNLGSHEEFTFEHLTVGPGAKAYTVEVYADLTPDEASPTWGLFYQDTRTVTDPMISQYNGTFGPTYRKQIKIEIKNMGSSVQTFYYSLSAYAGTEMPQRK